MSVVNKTLLSEWHTAVKIPVSNDTLIKRINAFNIILDRSNLDLWQDILKLYLGIKTESENVTFFVKTFQNEDDEFPRMNLEKLIKSLAGLALALKLNIAVNEIAGEEIEEEEEDLDNDADDSDDDNADDDDTDQEEEEDDNSDDEIDYDRLNYILSTAIVNSTFFNLYKIETKIPVINNAVDYLTLKSGISRHFDLETFEEKIESIELELAKEDSEGFDIEESRTLTTTIKTLVKSNRSLSEEVNILWWLFGEYSEIADKYFNELGVNKTAVIASKELANITNFFEEHVSAKNILSKILLISNKNDSNIKSVSIKTVIDGLDLKLKTKITDDINQDINEFTPCLLALKKANEKKDWEKSFGKKITDELHPRAIALQFFREFMFLKAIK